METGKEVKRLEGHQGAVLGLAFTSDGKTLVTGGKDQAVRFWDVESGKEVAKREGHRGAVRCVAVAADGSIATAGDDGAIFLWQPPGRSG